MGGKFILNLEEMGLAKGTKVLDYFALLRYWQSVNNKALEKNGLNRFKYSSYYIAKRI